MNNCVGEKPELIGLKGLLGFMSTSISTRINTKY